jgi:hypothetical protein
MLNDLLSIVIPAEFLQSRLSKVYPRQNQNNRAHALTQGILKGKYHCTIDLLFVWQMTIFVFIRKTD